MTVHKLTHHAQTRFEAPCAAVFDAATLPPSGVVDRHTVGAVLALTPIWGKPGEPGYQVTARFNWGAVDLEMTESTLVAERPLALRIAHRPDRYLPYDPAERLPPIDSDVPARLEALFDRTFGNPPIITEIDFQFAPDRGGTTVDLRINARTTQKPGWFKTRRWHKTIPQQTAAIFARIGEGLQVQ